MTLSVDQRNCRKLKFFYYIFIEFFLSKSEIKKKTRTTEPISAENCFLFFLDELASKKELISKRSRYFIFDIFLRMSITNRGEIIFL